jgi:hypothetical protein
MNGAKINCVKLEPPSIMVVIRPICNPFPPASTSMAGIIVSTSIKFWASARKDACQRKE